MSTHNIGFYEDLTKNIFELLSNTHLISSADPDLKIRSSSVQLIWSNYCLDLRCLLLRNKLFLFI